MLTQGGWLGGSEKVQICADVIQRWYLCKYAMRTSHSNTCFFLLRVAQHLSTQNKAKKGRLRSQEYQDGRDYSVTISYLFEKIKNANKNRGISKSKCRVTICAVVRGNLCILYRLGILVSLFLGGRLETFLITRLRERREKMWVQPTYPTSYPKVYTPSAIKTQMNLVSFCFLADWAVLGITEISNN